MTALIDHNSPFLLDLDFNNLNSQEQALVDALIDVASTLIEKECNRIFSSQTYTDEKLNGDNLNSVFVKNIPLTSLISVTLLPDTVDEVTYPDSDHTIDDIFNTNELTGEIWFKSFELLTVPVVRSLRYFPEGRQNVLVTYTGGFADVPTPIQMLCADMVMSTFSGDPGASGNIEAEKLGQYFYKVGKDISEQLLTTNKRIISMYKIRKV